MTDRFASIDYHALVDWPSRLAREWPLLEQALGSAPSRRVLDLGCGPGEHSGLLARHGFDVVAVDSSPSMLETARSLVSSPAVRFVAGDLVDIEKLVDGRFGGAICLGNTLPSIRTRESLARLLGGLRARLLPGASFVMQLLNYEKILKTGQRYLPLTVRPTGDGSIVFVRLMDPRANGDLVFSPIVLRHRPDAEPTVTIEGAERVEVHGWTRGELEELLDEAGFGEREWFGSVAFEPYLSDRSTDLVVIAKA